MDNINIYSDFSHYYRELITYSGRLSDEINLMSQVLGEFSIARDANILDAACGCGDLASYLIHTGYHNTYANDGSSGMAIRAKEICPESCIYNYEWESLNLSPSYSITFDFIYMLSISFPHLKEEHIQTVLKYFYEMLNNKDYLVFDTRDWINSDIGLIEANRINNIELNKGYFIKDNEVYQITDVCRYYDNRQHITYRICKESESACIVEFNVSYSLVSVEQYKKYLSNVGFINIRERYYQNWPYKVIIADKGC